MEYARYIVTIYMAKKYVNLSGAHPYTVDTFINVINIFCTFINYINMFHEKNKWSLIIPLVAIIN